MPTIEAKKIGECALCMFPVFEGDRTETVYFRHGNGGAYGSGPAHWDCFHAPCSECGECERNQYGECKNGCEDRW